MAKYKERTKLVITKQKREILLEQYHNGILGGYMWARKQILITREILLAKNDGGNQKKS